MDILRSYEHICKKKLHVEPQEGTILKQVSGSYHIHKLYINDIYTTSICKFMSYMLFGPIYLHDTFSLRDAGHVQQHRLPKP